MSSFSDRRCRPMPPESISRLARTALNDAGLADLTLGDLRRDFIIRQLEQHDWPYAARVSGISVSTPTPNLPGTVRQKSARNRLSENPVSR